MADDQNNVVPIMGRPTKYEPVFCEQLITHMSEGLSYESFAGFLGVSKKTLYNWETAFPDFLHAKEVAVEKCRLWWESKGIDGMLGRFEGFSAGTWIFNMKNRFTEEWRDRHEFVGSAKPSNELEILLELARLTPEQLKQRHADLLESDRAYVEAKKRLAENSIDAEFTEADADTTTNK